MKCNRWFTILMLAVGLGVALVGCTAPAETDTIEPEEPTEETETETEGSPPGPGPIIDIIEGGGGGNIVYRYNKTDMNVGSPTTDTLDPDFFKKALGIFLADAQDANGLGRKEYWKVDGGLTIESATGRVEVSRNSTTMNLEWTCYDDVGTPTTLIAGNDLDIPACMLLTGATIKGVAGPTTFQGDVVLIGVEGP